MEDDSVLKIKGIDVVNTILNYFYLGMLVMCFILALGNRPQGSKRSYTLAFIGFAFITIYMTVCPCLLDVLACSPIEEVSSATFLFICVGCCDHPGIYWHQERL